MSFRRGPTTFGQYCLLDRIAIGGMAEIWRAKTWRDGVGEQLVAVKRILPTIAENREFITMFIDEARIAVQLTHPNIAQILDLGKIGSSYFIALEYVAGRDLRVLFDHCRKAKKSLPVPMACYLVARMAEALDYAHRKRDVVTGQELHVVHRDVSPQNCLVGFEGEVKLIDFGIAKAAHQTSHKKRALLGKFGYMSPEQARGEPLDRRSDVFAAGIVLFEMLTGERLFAGESDLSELEMVRAAKIPAPSEVKPGIPPELDAITARALARDVEGRYPWAGELAAALDAFVAGPGGGFSAKDLSAYMKAEFSAELEKEHARRTSYAAVRAPNAPTESSRGITAPDLVLGQQADDDGSEPTVAMDISAHVPPPNHDAVTNPAMQAVKRPDEVTHPDRKLPALPKVEERPPKPTPAPRPALERTLSDSENERPPGPGRKIALAAALALIAGAGVGTWLAWSQKASLTLDYEPADAAVFVDGVEACAAAPCTAQGFPPGIRRIELRKDGYRPWARQVELVRGKALRWSEKIVLEESEKKVAYELRTDPPDAQVKIDGKIVKYVGMTEPFKGTLSVGEPHQVEVSRPGFNPWIKVFTPLPTDPPLSEFARLKRP